MKMLIAFCNGLKSSSREYECAELLPTAKNSHFYGLIYSQPLHFQHPFYVQWFARNEDDDDDQNMNIKWTHT